MPYDSARFLQSVHQGVEAWMGQAIDEAVSRLSDIRPGHPAAGRMAYALPALELLQTQRAGLVQRVAQAVRGRLQPAPDGGAHTPAGGGDGALTLALLDEAQIDEEIEVARIVQLIDSEAEAELQELGALCSGLRQMSSVDPEATPLRPAVCAQGLREGLAGLPLETPVRLLLLQTLGTAVGRQMRQVYRDQARLLADHGVQPAAFRIRSTPSRPGSDAALPRGVTRPAELTPPDLPTPAAGAMERLVQWAQEGGIAPAASSDGSGLSLRLDLEPVGHAPGLDRPAAERLMERLFAQLATQAEVSPAARDLVRGLERTGRSLAQAEPGLWSNPDHPWWTLLDRLLAVGAVHDDLGAGDAGPLQASLRTAVDRIQAAPALDRDACQAAADEVQAAASRLMEAERTAPAELDAIQRAADRDEQESELRQQVVQQLRSTPVCSELRRFFLGPWLAAMTEAALRHGKDSAELAQLALVLDDLMAASARPGQRVSKAQRNVLLRQVGDGLALAGLPEGRAEVELQELAQLLRDPPEVGRGAEEAWEEPAPPALPTAHVLDLHAGLPTVPLAMDGQGDAELDPLQWVGGLQVGTYCRLFLQGRWMTAQLGWVSATNNLFLFNSRHGGRSHSLTRRMLGKLRAAGLATHIEDGFLLAQAMDTLATRPVP